MHLAALMHSDHVICIVGVSRGVRFVKEGEMLSRGRDFVKGARYCQGGRPPPFAPP